MRFIFFRGTYFAKKDDKGVSYYFRYLYVSDLSLFHFRKILLGQLFRKVQDITTWCNEKIERKGKIVLQISSSINTNYK